MRNLGGSIGIALLQTLLTRREQFHSAVINPSVSLLNAATRQRLAGLRQYFMATGTADPATACHDAVVAVGYASSRLAMITISAKSCATATEPSAIDGGP